MSYADVFGGQGSPQWATLATGVGGSSQPVPARSMSGYRFRNMSGCVVQLLVDGTLQDEFEPYSEGSGYLGYPGQSIQQVQYEVQKGDPVELSNYAIASWRCLVELVPVDLPYQRVRMSATITGTVQLAPGSAVGVSGTVNVGNSPTVLQGGVSPWSTGNIREYLGSIQVVGTFSVFTHVGVQAVQPYHTMLFVGTGQSISRFTVAGHTTGLIFFDAPITAFQIYPVPLVSAQDTSVDFLISNGPTAVNMFINVYSTSSAGPVVPLTNYGGAPLVVQPASGSQQTVVPGAAASSIINVVVGGAVFSRVLLGSLIARPTSIYAIAWAASASMTSGTAGTQGWGSMIFLGLKGNTSGSELWLAACGLQIPAINVGTATNEVAANGGFTVFPYPLSLASLLPTDAQVQPQLAYVPLSGVIPTGAIDLLG